MFKEYYRRRFREILGKPLQTSDGLGDRKVELALRKLGLVIPQALADYYSVAGCHEINTTHNRLYSIENLEWKGDRLLFMEENQWVVFWGIDRAGVKESNPVVWQAINREPEPLEWFVEPFRLNQFLMACWRWQITGIEEEAE